MGVEVEGRKKKKKKKKKGTPRLRRRRGGRRVVDGVEIDGVSMTRGPWPSLGEAPPALSSSTRGSWHARTQA